MKFADLKRDVVYTVTAGCNNNFRLNDDIVVDSYDGAIVFIHEGGWFNTNEITDEMIKNVEFEENKKYVILNNKVFIRDKIEKILES